MTDKAADPYCLDDLEDTLDDDMQISFTQQVWLLQECRRLMRANKALDGAQASHDEQIRDKDRELFGLHSELADWMDRCRALDQTLEIARYEVAYSRGLAEKLAHQS